jgi:thiol-disulfide isomerase/thioredoxin
MISVPYAYHTQAIQRWLTLLGLTIPTPAIDTTLENHPEWPSLLCVSDALNGWKVPHAAAKDEAKMPEQIRTPFLAVTHHPERPFAIVTQVLENDITLFQENYKKEARIAKESFLQQWTGVYMLAEPTAKSRIQPGQADYKKTQSQKVITVLAAFSILCLLGYHFMPHVWNVASFATGLGAAIIFVLYIAGIAISSLLLWHEIDKGNPILQKVCTGIAKTNCNAILDSKASKLLPWLSWSEVGFLYFMGGALLLAMPGYAPWALDYLAIVSIAALIYPIFSIYYQWRVVKQWCALCLAIQAILLLQFAAALFFILPTDFSFIHFTSILPLLIAYGLPALLWYSLKPLLQRLYTAKQERRAYHRLKFNPDVFEALLKKQKAIQTSTVGIGILLGELPAQNTLVKVCHPFCGPCINTHPKIHKLLAENENLNVEIIFMTTDKPGDIVHKTISHIIAATKNLEDNKKKHQVLDDWYLPEKKDYSVFAKKYPLNGEIAKVASKITEMGSWCNKNKIEYTPTIFFNGHELPKEYDLEDIRYFLQE